MRWAFLILMFYPSITLGQSCFDQAGERYRVAPHLLRAIANQESGMNPKAIHTNKDGTKDFGIMQINERWMPQLRQFGISKEGLMDPCQNIHVSAYILRNLYNRYGENWKAVGHYNATHPIKAAKYAWKIHQHLTKSGEPIENVRR
jgi:soluble lytic murein transglycosylase-like protein